LPGWSKAATLPHSIDRQNHRPVNKQRPKK